MKLRKRQTDPAGNVGENKKKRKQAADPNPCILIGAPLSRTNPAKKRLEEEERNIFISE